MADQLHSFTSTCIKAGAVKVACGMLHGNSTMECKQSIITFLSSLANRAAFEIYMSGVCIAQLKRSLIPETVHTHVLHHP